MELEIQRHDWSNLRALGDVSKVPEALRLLKSASTEAQALDAYWRIDNVVVVQGALYQAAVPTATCLITMLCDCTDIARRHILELLVQIGSGVTDPSETKIGESDLSIRCLKEIEKGFPIYVAILEKTRDPDELSFCIDLLGLSVRANPILKERVRWYYERIMQTCNLEDGVRQLVGNWLEEVL